MIEILHGDALEKIKLLKDKSIDCIVTSPPYWRLKDYENEKQLGLEETPEVLDPFLGSGTTLKVAKRLNRNGTGIELNRRFIEITKKRIGNDLFNEVQVR